MKANKKDWALISLIVLAAFFRFWMLDLKPPHHDEGVNGAFVETVYQQGYYRYDPQNYHGPLHFYLLVLSQALFGRSIWALRFPTALIGIFCVWLMYLFSSLIGRRAAIFAALFAALSPGLVFYSRHAIHETELVLFTLLAVWGFWGMRVFGGKRHLWAFALGLVGMAVTKETFIIHVGAFLAAWICLVLWEKALGVSGHEGVSASAPPARYSIKEVTCVIAVSLFVALFFFSGTFLNLKEVPGFIKMLFYWSATGFAKGGHAKPFHYWATTLVRYEYPVIVGALVALALLVTRLGASRIVRHTGIYGIGVFLAYSIIPYKTTWCVVNLIWPFLICLGWFLDYGMTKKPHATVTLALLLLLASLTTNWDVNYVRYDDYQEPYTYVQTSREIHRLTDRLDAVTAADPSAFQMPGYILRQDSSWPMPWMLGAYKNIGWYEKFNRPSEYDGDLIVVDQSRIKEAESFLTKPYYTDQFSLIAGQSMSKIYFSPARFKNLFPGKSPDFIPAPREIEVLAPGGGLRVSYFKRNEEGKARSPLAEAKTAKIDLAWGGPSRPTEGAFEVELEGEILVKDGEKFLFVTDDGGFIEIDGKRIVNDPGPHACKDIAAVYKGESGWKKIKVWYYDIGGYAVLRLFKEVKPAEGVIPASYEVVPSSEFRSQAEVK